MAKMGRPKKYTERFLRQEGEELLEWLKQDNNFFLVGFCTDKSYSWEQFCKWARRSKHFSRTLKKAHDIQKDKIVKGMASGKMNSTACIFTLKNIAGWRDNRQEEKREVDVAEHLKAIANAIRKSDTGKS